MLKTLRQIYRVGIATEPPPDTDDALRLRDALQSSIRAIMGRALCIRQVDAGSCNGCELEIHALNNPLYNIEGLGVRFVASPRHADMLLVTGPVSTHMAVALQRTFDATPDPKLVVAIGDCGCTGGIFGESYAQLRSSLERDSGGHRSAWLSTVADADSLWHPDGPDGSQARQR